MKMQLINGDEIHIYENFEYNLKWSASILGLEKDKEYQVFDNDKLIGILIYRGIDDNNGETIYKYEMGIYSELSNSLETRVMFNG
jgi:hypothetical protein